MKKALVTLCIGEAFSKILESALPSFKQYAEKIGAELFVITEKEFPEKEDAHFGKSYISDLLERYDRIIYFDSDILISPETPDLFEVPEDQIGIYNEGKLFEERKKSKSEFLIELQDADDREIEIADHEWASNSRYFNTGVMVVSKKHKGIFENLKSLPRVKHYFEQTGLNYLIYKDGTDVYSLNYRFNRMPWVNKTTGESRFASYVLHYAGDYKETLAEQMKLDWEFFKKNKDPLPRRICIYLGGGLGDQVACEPLIRWAYENFYKKDQLIVYTHYPELFEKYPYPIQFKKYGDTLRDEGFCILQTYPADSVLSTSYTGSYVFSPNLMHPLDYSSLNALGRTLIREERRVLLPEFDHYFPVENTILVHAGRSWPSKTFSREYWEETVIAAINEMGFSALLVGSDAGGTTGVVKVERADSLVNDTTIPELISLCRQARGVITNDSSIAHIAGACRTPVGLLSTVKKGSHIMPHDSVYVDLCTGVIDRPTEPNQLDEIHLDTVDPGELEAILPDKQRIMDLFLKNL